jgi:peptidoglycan/LPS O-acetylase OafA/YrhL
VTTPGQTLATTRGEIRSLTGLRIVAAVWVVAFHFSFTPGDAWTAAWEPLRPLVQTGALGVDLFYVLSGFVITLTYLEKAGRRPSVRGTVVFWWARIGRIWPVYAVVTTLFGAWILYKDSRTTDDFLVWQLVQPEVGVWSYLQQLAMVQLWARPAFDGSSWVGAAWSISAEWAAYVLFPLLVLVLWRLRTVPSWLTGLLAVRRIRITPRVERIAAGVSALAVVEILIGLWWGYWRGQGHAEYGGVVVVLFPVLVGSLALSRRGLGRLLASEPMVHGGRISFSLYLVHVPVFEVLWTHMDWYPAVAPGSALGSFLVPHVLLLCFVLAHLSYRYLEEPARLWLRGRGPGRLTPAARPPVVPATAVPLRLADAPVPPVRISQQLPAADRQVLPASAGN